MDFRLTFDVEALKQQLEKESEDFEQRVRMAVHYLARQTHAKLIELAESRLHSTRSTYVQNTFFQETSPNLSIVGLREPAMWIEEGLEPHSMVDDLLKKGATTAKDGSRYKAIPFDQAKAPTETPIAARSLGDTLRQVFRKEKISLKKIERNPDGSPKLGLLHKLDIDSAQKGPTGIPYLYGISVYQRMNKEGSVQRSVMTFRTVSTKHKAQGRWFHPGLEPKHFIEQVYRWAESQWNTEVVPELLKG